MLNGESVPQRCVDCPRENCREHGILVERINDLQKGADERRQSINELKATDAELNLKLLEAINVLNEKLGDNLQMMTRELAEVRSKQSDNFILLLLAILGAIVTILFEARIL